jgi:hypothetical protein
MKRFTLRDLFWLVFVAAISLGWLVHYRSLSRETAKLQEQVKWLEAESFSARASAYSLHQELLKRDAQQK